MRASIAVPAGLLLVLSGAAQTQTDTQAREILMRAGTPLFAASNLRITGTKVVRPDARNAESSEIPFVLTVTRDGRVRNEEGVGDKLKLQVFDGSTLSVYSAATKTYSQSAAKIAPPRTLDLLRFGRDSANILSAAVEHEEFIPFGGQQTRCYVIRATYKGMPGKPDARNVVRTAWITRDSEIVARDSWEVDVSLPTGAGRSELALNFSSVEWDATLSGDVFAFHPPEGSKAAPLPKPARGGGIGAPAGARRTPPAVVQRVAPEYSAEARAANYQGSVLVSVYVDEEGRPQDVRLIRGLGMGLDGQALSAVRHWQFRPATNEGKPVRAMQPFEVEFRLPDGGPWSVAGTRYTPLVPRDSRGPRTVITNPALVEYAAPDREACAASEYVAVNLQIGENGIPGDIKATPASGAAMQQAVVKAAASWKFDPARADRKRVPANATIVLRCESPAPPVTAADRPQTVYRVGGGTTSPNLVFKVEPEYSEEARKAKLQGNVVMFLVIDDSGKPVQMQVLRPLGLGLDQKALEAVAQWRFRPGMKEGKPVSIQATVEVNFRLL